MTTTQQYAMAACFANDLSGHCTAARWMPEANIHRVWADEAFRKLAAELGYDLVERKSDEVAA